VEDEAVGDLVAELAVGLELLLVEKLVGGRLVGKVVVRALVTQELEAHALAQRGREIDEMPGAAVRVDDLRDGIRTLGQAGFSR
jgi:hypothetical protein